MPNVPININNQPVTGVSAPFIDPHPADTHTCTVTCSHSGRLPAGMTAAAICTKLSQTHTETLA